MNKENIKEEEDKIPSHIVLLPDGNRRWARESNMASIEGHKAGFENLKKFCSYCQERGIKILTAFGFSVENWNRPTKEVKYLMQLLEHGLLNEIEDYYNKESDSLLIGDKIKVRIIGEKDRLPQGLQDAIKKIEDLTKDNKDYVLNLAVSYSGRWDIIQAIKRMVKEKLSPKKISEALFNDYLSTEGMPLPDLIIRTGGEKRLSNFLLWQAAYSELYFSEKYWPDFNKEDFNKAIAEYSHRKRRFGR
jgi:undecaprenyl diphosphate synthase